MLQNLQNLEGDIVFIKNIDNVAPDWLKPATTEYKKILGGYFLQLEGEMFDHLRVLSAGKAIKASVREAWHFCGQKLQLAFPADFSAWPFTGSGKCSSGN